MKIVFNTLLILFFLTSFFELNAQSTPSLEFLTIGASAKQLTMGDATTAVPLDGLNALVNPATLSGIEQNVMSANYTVWISGTQIRSFSVVLTEPKQRLSFSFLSNSTGDIEIRNTPGEPISNGSVEYLALTAAYAYSFSPEFSVGISGSYLNEQYIVNYANGYSFGLGFYSSLLSNRVRLGASVNHLGEMQKLNAVQSQLPSQFRIGTDADLLRLTFPGSMDLPLLFSVTADYVKYLHKLNLTQNDSNVIITEQLFTTGVRLLAADMISIQTGYRFLSDEVRKFSFGIGVYHNDFQFDFAFLPLETGFNSAYSIGMRYQF